MSVCVCGYIVLLCISVVAELFVACVVDVFGYPFLVDCGCVFVYVLGLIVR